MTHQMRYKQADDKISRRRNANIPPSEEKRTARLLGTIFGLIGLLLLVIGTAMTVHEWQFGNHAVFAQGIIVDSEVDNTDDGTTYHPMVQFTTARGEQIQFTSEAGTSHNGRGESVSVLYAPDNPHNARVNSLVHRWLGPLILFPMGLVFSLISLLFSVVVPRLGIPIGNSFFL